MVRKYTKKEKAAKGAAANFITRNKALKKLQVTLADFRRLCILKGIYPREPRNKKKANKGSTAPVTFYYAKDIQYLLHEPLLQKFRDYKVFARKLSKLKNKGVLDAVQKFEDNNKPKYTLAHLVKERYPSFADALRDLDDALCMLFLFATLPNTNKRNQNAAMRCQRLCSEFEHYVIRMRAIRKTFVSIKGIYYQAEVKGQIITWVVPHQFSQEVPTDVDFRVMNTFLEFYETLVGFVNFRLFADLNLVYPPRIDAAKDEGDAGLNALIIESVDDAKRSELAAEGASQPLTVEEKNQKAASEKRLKTLSSKLADIDNDADMETEEPVVEETKEDEEMADPKESTDNGFGDLPDVHAAASRLSDSQSLFSGCVVFLSREVPRHSLELLIRSFGGRVAWDPIVAAGSPYNEADKAITHHICDRPQQQKLFLGRTYIQPQWVYDSINAGKIMSTDTYAPGSKLPPHLSPFQVAKEGDYVPLEALEQEAGILNEDGDAEDEEVEIDEDDVDKEEEEEEDEDEADEERDKAEIEAEAAGISFTEYQQRNKKKAAQSDAGKKRKAPATKVETPAEKKQRAKEAEEKEKRELAIGMLGKKDLKLLKMMQHGVKRKQETVDNLARKRQELVKSEQNKKKNEKKLENKGPKKGDKKGEKGIESTKKRMPKV